ncbi:XRE family transcriptional regulator [Oceanobacillus kimchii]|uniref:XRE family transcriptional regulator n=1 Tax=Oceanobacillus kimchii TaxID=746691 RepID=UPI003C770D94
MNYFEMLNEMIEESKLTLKEIAFKCEDYGVKVNPSYISKLKSGKQPPASDEINSAIVKACGFEEEVDNILFEAYKEKAPTFVKEFLQEMIDFFRITTKAVMNSSFPDDFKELMESQLEQMSDYEIIINSISSFKGLNNFNEVVPVNSNIEYKLVMTDDSMEPKIPKGASVYYKITNDIENGDIVVIVENGNYYIRRYVAINNEIVMLPEKKSFKVKEFEEDKDIILAKVTSISIEF